LSKTKYFFGGVQMVTFSVPEKLDQQSPGSNVFSFTLETCNLLIAGSRNLTVDAKIASLLLQAFASLDFSFMTGCANGVDKSFKKALALSPYKDRCFIACAFKARVNSAYGLYASKVVPDGLPPKVALYRRTLWMVKRCSMALLFPIDPLTGLWGKGSRLVFNSSMFQLKPVFVVSDKAHYKTDYYKVVPSSLFGIVKGYWAVPYPISKGGTCDEGF